MSTTNIVITIVVIAIIIVGGAYFTGYFDEAPAPAPAATEGSSTTSN